MTPQELKKKVSAAKNEDTIAMIINDPGFDSTVLDSLIKKLVNQSLDFMFYPSSKKVLNLIISNPLIKYRDLIAINNFKAKSGYNSGRKIYNSNLLNLKIAEHPDAPEKDLLKIIKILQFDTKLAVSKRKDISKQLKETLVHYTLKHHIANPKQVKEILKNLKINIKSIGDQLEKLLLEFFLNARVTQNPLPALSAFSDYGIEAKLEGDLLNKLVAVIIERLKSSKITERAVLKELDKNPIQTSSIRTELYKLTGSDIFLPIAAKEIFIF